MTGYGDVVGFGSYGVCLAVHLLHQKIQFLALSLLGTFYNLSELYQVTVETGYLLVYGTLSANMAASVNIL